MRQTCASGDQGFVKEEDLERYAYERGGLIPGQWEFEGLGRQMWERGVDIVTAADIRAAVVQRTRGADVYIVGGWRSTLGGKLIAAKGITRPEQLRGGRSVLRETWGLNHIGIVTALRHFGVGPDDIEWIETITQSAGDHYDEEGGGDLLRSGKVTLLPAGGREANRLLAEGYPLVLDLAEFYQGLGGWPPGKVIVSTRQMIEERGEELRAFLRASLRGFWFTQDPRNHRYLYDLETRLRETTYNDYERKIRMLSSPTPPPPREGPNTMGAMVMDGLVPRPLVARLIEDMVQFDEIPQPIAVDDVLKDAASNDAYRQLFDRGLIDLPVLEQWRDATYGRSWRDWWEL